MIIANPNGITCDACGFINTNRVDLVTGSGYNANTNTFGSIAASDINIASSGLTASVLKIQTGADFINAGTINADTVTIEVTNFANDIENTGTVSSASLNFILTDSFTHNSTSFSGFNNFSNLAITTDGTFTNNATINLTGNLYNHSKYIYNTGGVVNADALALSVAGDFDYGTITANTFNLNVGGNFSYNNSANDLDWGVNDSLTVLGSASVVADDFANRGTITVTNSLNLITFASGGVISADTFALSVAGDFDYIADYLNNGTITTNVFNLNVGGDFTFSESANNFIWRANDTLTVSGSANITAASFNNSGTIDVDNSFNATVGTFINESGATISAFGECNIVATTSSDNGTINCLDFAIEAMVFNIATPNSNGLSDNQVDIFDVSTDGTILNNSAVGGTTQFRSTDVEGNSNITAGSEASLILFQVTGSTVSALNGTLEVFGGEAGLIIANPNGIVCTGCAFINANRLDLVTGNYDADTNTSKVSV